VGPVRRGSVILDVKVDPETAKRLSEEGGSILEELLHAKVLDENAASAQPESSEGRPVSDLSKAAAGGDSESDAEIVLHSGDHVDVVTGLYTLSSIGGRVFHDIDADGYFEPAAGETGVSGVVVTLYDAEDDELLASAQTNSAGEFSFVQAEPGDYYLHFDPAKKYKFSPLTERSGRGSSADRGGVIVNDVFPSSGNTSILTLSSGRKSLEVNAGIYALATIRGVWFVDKNGNGRMDTESTNQENFLHGSGLERGSLELISVDNNQQVVATIDVASLNPKDGSYRITDLRPGQYSVRVTAPLPNYSVTPKWLGYRQSGTIYNDIDPSDGQLDQVFLKSDETLNVNVGVFQPASISGIVWEDMDGVGSTSLARKFLKGAHITLISKDGRPSQSTVSVKGGVYSFSHLAPGAYSLRVQPPSTRYRFSPRLDATDRSRVLEASPSGAIFSDVDPISAETATYYLESGTTKSDANIGLYTYGIITGLVWDDLDASGKFDPQQGEKGLPAIPVKLEKKDGSLVSEVVTDAEGRYTFLNLEPGRYRAPRITPPQDYHRSVNAKITYAFMESDADTMMNEDI
jgi:serine-aspartate repeat-containing protein C/D/E